MKVSRRDVVACAVAAATISWPFTIMSYNADQYVAVSPNSQQHVVSQNRGGDDIITFELTNIASRAIRLDIVHKTCKCIGTRLRSEVLAPQERTIVDINARVPVVGMLDGTIVVEAHPLNTNGDLDAASQKVVLQYEVEAVEKSGLDVAPANVDIEERDWRKMRKLVVSCSLRFSGPPQLVVATEGESRVDVNTLAPWREFAEGRFAATFELALPEASNSNDRIITIEATAGKGLKHRAQVRLHTTHSNR